MSESVSRRQVAVERVSAGRYVARNERGGEVAMGTGRDGTFTPVELLLAAVGGCSAVDVDVATSRRAEPETFVVDVAADKVSGPDGSVLRDVEVTFTVRFPAGEEGDAARQVLPRAVRVSHDSSCSVSRTVEAATSVTFRVAD